MNTKMDGVKILVNDESENEEVSEPKREEEKPVAKKKTVTRKKITKTVEEKKESSKNERGMKDAGGLMSLVVSVVLTAVIVGGGIYFWQHSMVGKNLKKISADATASKEDFEKRLENLKEKLSGTEKEKENLLAAQKELEIKAELLKSAKKQYVSNDLGFSFFYPATFGDVSIEFVQKATGTVFNGKFSLNDKLIFSGVSTNYVSEATSSVHDFIETQGFLDQKNKYYFEEPGKKDSTAFEIQPVKIIGYRGGEALVINKKSFVGQDEFTKNAGKPFVDIGENIGALLNLKNDKYKGLAFVNMDFGLMPMESFEEMLKTVEVK